MHFEKESFDLINTKTRSMQGMENGNWSDRNSIRDVTHANDNSARVLPHYEIRI